MKKVTNPDFGDFKITIIRICDKKTVKSYPTSCIIRQKKTLSM